MPDKKYNPPMHTAEHILNRTMQMLLGTERSFSSHLDGKKGKCDYRFNRNLTEEERSLVQDQVNRTIARNLPVTEEHLSRDTAAGEFNLSRLPESAGNTVRIVRVGDYDACPCIGPHAGNTSELGVLRILSSDHADGVLRIRFKLEDSPS